MVQASNSIMESIKNIHFLKLKPHVYCSKERIWLLMILLLQYLGSPERKLTLNYISIWYKQLVRKSYYFESCYKESSELMLILFLSNIYHIPGINCLNTYWQVLLSVSTILRILSNVECGAIWHCDLYSAINAHGTMGISFCMPQLRLFKLFP